MVTEVKIRKNVPLPDPWKKETTYAYPFDDMIVGDSFAIPFTEKNKQKIIGRVSQACSARNKNLKGTKLVTRVLKSSFGVWLVKKEKNAKQKV
jgi:hypothetical protein